MKRLIIYSQSLTIIPYKNNHPAQGRARFPPSVSLAGVQIEANTELTFHSKSKYNAFL